MRESDTCDDPYREAHGMRLLSIPYEGLVETDAYARTRGHGPFTPDNEKQWAWLCAICRGTPAAMPTSTRATTLLRLPSLGAIGELGSISSWRPFVKTVSHHDLSAAGPVSHHGRMDVLPSRRRSHLSDHRPTLSSLIGSAAHVHPQIP